MELASQHEGKEGKVAGRRGGHGLEGSSCLRRVSRSLSRWLAAASSNGAVGALNSRPATANRSGDQPGQLHVAFCTSFTYL